MECWESKCAFKEQSMNRQRQEFFRQIELKEDKIIDLCARAKLIEEENIKVYIFILVIYYFYSFLAKS